MYNKKNLSHLAVSGVSFSLIAAIGAQAAHHKPGDFPSPPWPPHSHIEVAAPTVSSTTGNVTIADVSGMVGAATRRLRTEPAHFQLAGSDAAFSVIPVRGSTERST